MIDEANQISDLKFQNVDLLKNMKETQQEMNTLKI